MPGVPPGDSLANRAVPSGSEEEPEGGRRSLILARAARDARLDRNFLLLITLSAAIATLGLLQGSTAVVIGAMLISPLMGPIIGLGFGLATIDSVLIKRALVTLAAGTLLAIAVALVLVWLSPVRDVTPELQARTEPTLLDLGVAVIGGIAGVYAIMRKLSGVMVGVAIATALVPPLSTIGFGLATGRSDFAIGAALLYLTNTLAIALAATVVARLNRFGPSLTPQHTAMQIVAIVAVLGLLSVPLALSLDRLVREAAARRAVQSALVERLGQEARIDTLEVRLVDGRITVDGVALVAKFDPQLNSWLTARAERRFKRKAIVNLAQIRTEGTAALEAQRRLADRVAALEAGEAESRSVLTALGVGQMIPRSAVMVDTQLRQVTVTPGPFADTEQQEAFARALGAARLAHPLWQIDLQGELLPATGPAAENGNR